MQVLIAGIGNVFLGDDGFGVEVARGLFGRGLPQGVWPRDFGVRGFDLACSMLDSWDLVILVDAVRRGGEPGSIYVIELDCKKAQALTGSVPSPTIEPHMVDPLRAIELANALGEITAPVILVGCEPLNFGSDQEFMGLSVVAQRAVGIATEIIERMLSDFQQTHSSREAQARTGIVM